jgi:hypothetical protein
VIQEGFNAGGWASETDYDATLWLEETAVVVYAFDVDETLEVSKGPVKLVDLIKLREHGHIARHFPLWPAENGPSR